MSDVTLSNLNRSLSASSVVSAGGLPVFSGLRLLDAAGGSELSDAAMLLRFASWGDNDDTGQGPGPAVEQIAAAVQGQSAVSESRPLGSRKNYGDLLFRIERAYRKGQEELNKLFAAGAFTQEQIDQFLAGQQAYQARQNEIQARINAYLETPLANRDPAQGDRLMEEAIALAFEMDANQQALLGSSTTPQLEAYKAEMQSLMSEFETVRNP